MVGTYFTARQKKNNSKERSAEVQWNSTCNTSQRETEEQQSQREDAKGKGRGKSEREISQTMNNLPAAASIHYSRDSQQEGGLLQIRTTKTHHRQNSAAMTTAAITRSLRLPLNTAHLPPLGYANKKQPMTEYQEMFLPPISHKSFVTNSKQKGPYHPLKGTSAETTSLRKVYVTHKVVPLPPMALPPRSPPKDHRRHIVLHLDHVTHGHSDLHACPLDVVEVEVMEQGESDGADGEAGRVAQSLVQSRHVFWVVVLKVSSPRTPAGSP
ncbi:hypothetical protein JOQ06_000493 [Pogonophryne albipinna]|uniref:Uncharacterized protein n=1 Tax=Pogonophryne albipinna TaxID=1090488 RepID=A0AAD6F8B7_9TELE|nr:hypothetical protein JOQ06_000493 [Pogonophryne albipinna]